MSVGGRLGRPMAAGQMASAKLILAGIACTTLVGAATWLGVDQLREQRKAARAQEILSVLDLTAVPNFHERLDKVRTFINDNSVHKPNTESFRVNQGKPDAFLAGLLVHAKGITTEPIHMECSTRSGAMESILKAFGYDTRIIAVFDSKTNFRSHSFIEVMNPETKRWETQDPDYDIYWRSKSSDERVSLADSAQALDNIEPCGRTACGWSHISREGIKAEKLIDYLDIISITAKEKTLRFALYTSRAQLSRTYSKGRKQGTFCEVEAKRCKHGFYDITKFSTYEPGLTR
jgi:hypothetical protein